MIFYVKAYREQIKDNYKYPCFILVSTAWDDYGFKTSFELQFYPERSNRQTIGGVKIMDLENEGKFGPTVLQPSFNQLDENFCSLGTSPEYYENIKNLSEKYVIIEVFEALNDLALMPGLIDKFEHTNAFVNSLMREREAKSAFLLGDSIMKGIPLGSNLKFSFTTKLKNADLAHSVKFEFDRDSILPGRIFAIVGKNGTGKTVFLSNLANAVGYTKRRKKEIINDFETGIFDTELGPPFRKVISLSYSLFDTFKRPNPSKNFSYIYCGIRNDEDEIDKKQLQERHIDSLKTIAKKQLGEIWVRILSRFVDLKLLGYEYDDWPIDGVSNIDELELTPNLQVSSGHSMLIYTITELIAKLAENSLILFDEPENHLHPNAIANLINSLNELAITFNSFVIICTHSPIVIQQIPSKYVYIFEREQNTPLTRPLDIESFGENLTVITKHIFETNQIDEGFKYYLTKLSEKNTFDEICALFNDRLSLNAKTFLSNLFSK